jgi:cob(I)alamin adenosyltransferase
MPKIYTRAGDGGETGLFGDLRLRKDDPRIEALGAVDELNASVGLVRAELARGGIAPPQLDSLLDRLQHQLFDLGAELATPAASAKAMPRIGSEHVTKLEAAIDELEEGLEPLRTFVLPGGAPAAAALHVARGVCRRAERRVVALSHVAEVRSEIVSYLNRLSDLLFVAARAVNRAHRLPDVLWKHDQT